MKKTVLITGANRGLGFGFVKQMCTQNEFRIIACCRNPDKAEELKKQAEIHRNISIARLDVADDSAINALAEELRNTPLDWIINNAGITGEQGVTVGNIDRNNFLSVFNVNCIGPLKISDTFLPNLKMGNDRLVVCISSRMGSISENTVGRSYAYRTSKAALNCAMRSFALDTETSGFNVLLLDPGWVRTDLGGTAAPVSVQTSISGMLEVIDRRRHDSHAEALYGFDGKIIAW